jgi:hypothetical protein
MMSASKKRGVSAAAVTPHTSKKQRLPLLELTNLATSRFEFEDEDGNDESFDSFDEAFERVRANRTALLDDKVSDDEELDNEEVLAVRGAFVQEEEQLDVEEEMHLENKDGGDDEAMDDSIDYLAGCPLCVSQLGIYCPDENCKCHIGLDPTLITEHLKKHHENFDVHKKGAGILKQLKKGMERLKEKNDLSQLFVLGSEPKERWCCSVCGITKNYATKKSFKRHAKKCQGAEAVARMFRRTVCHRYHPCPTVEVSSLLPNEPPEDDCPEDHPLNCHPAVQTRAAGSTLYDFFPCLAPLDEGAIRAEATDFEAFCAILEPFMRADEDISMYVGIFSSFFQQLQEEDDFEKIMKGMVKDWTESAHDDEQGLCLLLESAKMWLFKRARFEVRAIQGHYRAGLIQFDSTELAEINQNLTYNFRHKEDILWRELEHFLCFVWRHKGPLLTDFHKRIDPKDPFFIPRLLTTLQLEIVNTSEQLPVVMEYIFARCFRVNKDGALRMAQCGDTASHASSVLSMLRAGCCSMIYSLGKENYEVNYIKRQGKIANTSERLVKWARTSPASNLLAPAIRRFRECQGKKLDRCMVTTSPEGDISIGDNLYPRETWEKLAPIIQGKGVAALKNLLDGSHWKDVLDVNNPVRVRMGRNKDLHFWLRSGSKEVHSSGIKLKAGWKRVDLEKFHSAVVSELHGCGLGSARETEVFKLGFHHGIWHRGTLYYAGYKIKKFSIKSLDGSGITRKLSRAHARLFLLFRCVIRQLEDLDQNKLVPQLKGQVCYDMRDLYKDIFNLQHQPGKLHIRHLYTSICNILFDKNFAIKATAEDEIAEQSGHSAATHRSTYSTAIVNGMELAFRRFHRGIGDTGTTC